MKLIFPWIYRWAFWLLLLAAWLPQAKGANDFVPTGSMASTRQGHTATLLANGKVLVFGNGTTAELYDPATGLWSTTGSLTYSRGGPTATLLPNGKVLVTGGGSFAELYDPATGRWSTTGSLANGRSSHTATLLANGKVLVAGGGSQL